MPYCITVMESKSKRKIVIIILLIVAVLCLVYVWNFKYSTNITKLENEIINEYSSTDRYLQNYVILGQEKVSEEQTNYFAVAYTNYYKVVDPGVVKMTPYLEKSRKALAGCKADDICALEIFKTTGSGANMKIIGWEQGISSEGMERSPDANCVMLIKAKLYHAAKTELAQMDDDNLKRLKDKGYKLQGDN